MTKQKILMRYLLNVIGAEAFLLIISKICFAAGYPRLRFWVPAAGAGILTLIAHLLVRAKEREQQNRAGGQPSASHIVWYSARIIYRICFGGLLACSVITEIVDWPYAGLFALLPMGVYCSYKMTITGLEIRDLPYEPPAD